MSCPNVETVGVKKLGKKNRPKRKLRRQYDPAELYKITCDSMARYPHTKLVSNPPHTVVLSGPHIQVLDTQSGRVLHSTADFSREDEEGIIKSGPIRCSGISKDGRYLATTGDDKQLKIWDLESFALLSARALPKKPTSIEFSTDADILISDKFGDIFRYSLHPNDNLVEEKSARNTLASHENPSSGELVLGHASLVTTCLLTPDERFIITADRDEHIRVSWYPQGHVIESYCLGHKKYVSAIHIPAASPASLISGGGDPELNVWEWMTGRLQRNIIVFAAVKPFIRMAMHRGRLEPPNDHYRDDDDDDNDDEVIRSRGEKERLGKGKRRDLASLGPSGFKSHMPMESPNKTFSTTTAVFVVRRISSFLSRGENHVVFSVVGATAIFEFILAETDDQPEIRHHDFGKPVIDFTICGEGIIWVLLDADFPESNIVDERPHDLVQVVQWSIDRFINPGSSVLLDTLNTVCSLPAAAEDLKCLNLYADLSSLPKSTDGGQGSQVLERPEPIHQPTKNASTRQDASVIIGLTKRAQGRLKHKRALSQLRHKADGDDASGSGTKKMRAESDDEDSRM